MGALAAVDDLRGAAMTLDDLIALSKTPNVAAFLRVIREAESSQTDDAYRTLFGGGKFDGFASHPNQAVERMLGGKVVRSTAAGAYQFLSGTWREIASAYAITDFSPESQDAACVALIRRASALDDVIAGRVDSAIRKCASTWAGLPGDKYGQGGISMDRARAAYTRWGGTFEAPTTAAPITESQPTYEQPKESFMAPIIGLALPILSQLIPEIAKLFSSGSEVAGRNVKALEKLSGVLLQSTGAVNIQQAVEQVQSDPAALQAAREAIRAAYFELSELTEKQVAAAREFNTTWRNGEPFLRFGWLSLQFVEFLSLLLVAFSAYGGWVVLNGDGFSAEIKASVITLMLIGGFTGVLQFWLGSSQDSRKKTELMLK